MSDTDRMIQTLADQKGLYEKLLELSGAIMSSLSETPDEALAFMNEREKVLEQLKERDKLIAELVKTRDVETWMDTPEATKLKEGLTGLVKQNIETDKRLYNKITEAKTVTDNEMAELGKSWKTISGYGKSGRPVYARFIDFKS